MLSLTRPLTVLYIEMDASKVTIVGLLPSSGESRV